MAFRKGFVTYHDGAWHGNVPCESKEWYHVACEIDLNAQTFDIYVNDMKSPVERGANFWHPVNSLSYVLVRSYEGCTPYWIDKVFVYEGKLGTESSAVDAAGKKATVWGTIKDQY